MDVVSAMVLAREAASGAAAETLASARSHGYAVERTTHDATSPSAAVAIGAGAPRFRHPSLPATARTRQPNATPTGIKLAIPASFGSPVSGRRGSLAERSVALPWSVRTPRGRKLVLETVGFDDAPP